MKRVLILLSTYNGEHYLKEQLDSIYFQKGIDFHILVRDDGSRDRTLEILESYEKKLGKMTIICDSNVGAAMSFYKLLNIANTEYKDYDYYSFSDQDDVWMPSKLAESINLIQDSNSTYQLFYCRVIPTDASLKPIKTPVLRQSYTLAANIVSSRALGCTMVFNKNLLSKACSIWSLINSASIDNIPYHDGWLSLVAYSLDAKVVIGERPLMFYRQHEHNVIGTRSSNFILFKNRVRRYIKGDNAKSKKCTILLQVLGNEIPSQNKQILQRCAYYRNSFKLYLQLLCTKSLYCHSFIDNLGVFFVILFRKF